MSAHTPGPWCVCHHTPKTIYAGDDPYDGYQPVLGGTTGSEVSDEEELTNARLMAAAPELLDACRELAAWMESHGCVPPCLSRAKAVISKAESGE